MRTSADAEAVVPARTVSSAWPSYAAIATVGYLVYGLGAVAPYLRTRLGLSDTEVGLHSSALAVGFVLAGVATASFHRRYGEGAVRGSALIVLIVAILALGAAPSVLVTLAASVAIGWGAGTVLGYANASLASPGGVRARLQLTRANVWAMVAGFAAPVLLALAVTAGGPWSLGLAPAIVFLVLLGLDLRGGDRTDAPAGDGRDARPLPRAYWLAWTFLVAAIAAEFSIVFWAATLVERRTGVATTDATLIGAMFLAGMFAGRLVFGQGRAGGQALRFLTGGASVLAALGAGIAWVSTSPVLSGIGLFVAGLGVAILYPLGVAAALATAPGRLAHAGARLTLASGLAILVAPFALGAIADHAGVVTGWGLVLVLVAAALALVPTLPREADIGPA